MNDYEMIEAVCRALEISLLPQTTLVDAGRLVELRAPSFPADHPALILRLVTPEQALRVQSVLRQTYPAGHKVKLVQAKSGRVLEFALSELEKAHDLEEDTALYLPGLAAGTSLEAFHEVVAHLRASDGCPWDREQTHDSLRRYLLEETYEALEALDADDMPALREELGDLLLQILLHAQIAWESQEFTLAEVVQGIHDKIVRRHPHVFGEVQVDGVGGVLVNWEKLKQAERKANGEAEKGLLDGVPAALPALLQAQTVQDRARRVGFDWSEIGPVIAKVEEELGEVLHAPDEDSRAKELGDLLFAVVNVVRWYKVDAEEALRETTARFRRRFGYIERQARLAGHSVSDLSFEEMDALWEAAKDQE